MTDSIDLLKRSTECVDMTKEDPLQELERADQSALRKYASFFVGRPGMRRLLAYELITCLTWSRAGALGYWMRKHLYPRLCGEVGRAVQWGRNVTLRHAWKIRIGSGTVIDDNCLLCARGAEDGGFVIGEQVLIARGSTVIVKQGFVEIGDHCSIGSNTIISAAGGIRIGKNTLIAGQCYIGGGRYRSARNGIPMKSQGLYTKGPVEIGDDVWLGSGVRVLDGARIGEGAIVGAGAVVAREVPDYAIAAGVPARVISYR